METDPSVSVCVTGGGSGVGIAGLLNGRLDIASSSREINQHELLLASERNIDLEPFIFAADALAIICNPAVAIDSLRLEDLGKIFSGEIQNWQELDGVNAPISLYGRQSNSGTFMYFRTRVLGKDYCPGIKQMNGNAQILEAVKADPNSIGYIGFGYLTDQSGALRHGIKVIKLSERLGDNAISPLDKSAIKAGLYPLTRPLFQFTNGKPTGKASAFYDFEKSPEGQKIIAQNGYLPASEAGLVLNSGK
jgi:phosphate transport system substrate-binding protein